MPKSNLVKSHQNVLGTGFSLNHIKIFDRPLACSKSGTIVNTVFDIGTHCYTDGKVGVAPMLLDEKGVERFFCPERYRHSIALRSYLEKSNFEVGLVTPYKGSNPIYAMELHSISPNYCVYFTMFESNNEGNDVYMKVNSAYIRSQGVGRQVKSVCIMDDMVKLKAGIKSAYRFRGDGK